MLDAEREARDVFQPLPHVIDDFVAKARALTEVDVKFIQIRSKRVLTHFRAARPLRDFDGLRNLLDSVLHNSADAERLFKRGAGNAEHVDDQVSFIELGQKFAAHERHCRQRAGQQESGQGQHNSRMIQHGPEDSVVMLLQKSDRHRVFAGGSCLRQEEIAERRCDG